MSKPVTLDINPFNHDELDKKITDLTQQLQVMTADRNEFRAKFQDAVAQANDLATQLAVVQARVTELEQAAQNTKPVDNGHHFG